MRRLLRAVAHAASSACRPTGLATTCPSGIAPPRSGRPLIPCLMNSMRWAAARGVATEAAGGFRDFAVIAHVDHGKTTLLDSILSQCSTNGASERFLDDNSIERERGITIFSKYNSFPWRGCVLNAVDTPGHADFGGEVERVLDMVDGVVLLVDATEGPLAQTKFVLQKALRRGFRPIVVLNKVDRETSTPERCDQVESVLFDLFASLGASEEQLDFTTLYASGRAGWAAKTYDGRRDEGLAPLLDTILAQVPRPRDNSAEPFALLVSMIERDDYLGRIVTGRITAGRVKVGDKLRVLANGTAAGAAPAYEGRVLKMFKKRGMDKLLIDDAIAGDIVSLAGMGPAGVGDTLAGPGVAQALPSTPLDPPTISMTFSVNDSPLAGRDGSQLTGSKIGERLRAEAESNVSVQITPVPGREAYVVQGRGELQLGVLIENMRREGFELSISPPEVVTRRSETGEMLEPVEDVVIEVDEGYTGVVIEGMSARKGELLDMVQGAGSAAGDGRARLTYTCPSRGLLGYKSALTASTHGTAMLHRAFSGYEPSRGLLDRLRKGVLVSMCEGSSTLYALGPLEGRGTLFIGPVEAVYSGMIVGECSRDGDMEINPVKEKKLTNIRAAGNDDTVRLAPPRRMTLEEAIGYVAGDELIEVTPKSIRLRKKDLDENARDITRRNIARTRKAEGG